MHPLPIDRARGTLALALITLFLGSAPAAEAQTYSWRYYRPGNTGIQGDYNDAVFVGQDGDPWIGGYDPSFEEGGFAKFVQSENRWLNISNIDYPIIGHPNTTGTTRVSDIVQDGSGQLWLSTWRGALRYDPAVGPSSLVNFASSSSALANGGCRDLEIAPDGTIWFALLGWGGTQGGLLRYTPSTNNWHYWTGGSAPQGGNGWPLLVWSVANVAVQPKPAGGYVVWCEAENSTAIVSFDSGTQLFTHHEFSFTPGSMIEMPGKDTVDDAGNLWMQRFAGFSGSQAIYTLDYRRPDGTWVTPAQPALPAIDPPIWAFKAYGSGQALLADGNSNILRFDGTSWSNLGEWRPGAYTNSLDIDAAGNIWVAGIGGAARRNATTGQWQRYRVTNTSQYDLWNADLSLDDASGAVYACANAGSGLGGMTKFDGTRWIGYNDAQYGLGVPWPFPTDNSEAVGFRPSNGQIASNPMYNGLHAWNGTSWSNLQGMSRSRGLVEDSLGRLWSLGEYFSLQYLNGASWTTVPNNGTWGNNLQRDPSRAGTVWVSTYAEVIRTDGTYRYARTYGQFPELNIQSDIFGTVAAGPNGTAWLGSTKGMFKLNAVNGTYTYHTSLGGISCIGANPLAVTSDGRVWWNVSDINGTGPNGLAWWDGTHSGLFSAPRDGGPQWGGLPHAGIKTLKVRELANGYELWISCLSRGIAVLTVDLNDPAAVGPVVSRDTEFALEATPNPVTRSSALHFELPVAGAARLELFDASGRRVRTLFDATLSAGQHEWPLDTRGLAAGAYYCRLSTAGRSEATRLTLLR